MHIVQTGHSMLAKKKVLEEITKSFARYFNESDDNACRYTLPDDDENNASESVDVKKSGSAKQITEQGQPSLDRQNEVEITLSATNGVAGQLNYEGKLSNATEITGASKDEQQQECRRHEPPLAAVDDTQVSQVVSQVGNTNDKEGTIENLIRVLASLENGTNGAEHVVIEKMVATDANNSNLTIPNDDSCAEIGDNEAAKTVSDELSRYITFYDQNGKEQSSDEDKELEYLIGGAQATPEITKNYCSEAVTVVASERPISPTINEKYTSESGYDLMQDANNPMLFHIHVKGFGSLPDRNVTSRTHPSSFYFQGHEIKPCYIPLKDFRLRKRVFNPLDSMEFFLRRPKNAKRRRQFKKCHPRKREYNSNYKKGNIQRRKMGAKTKMVAWPFSLWDSIQESYPKQDTATVPSAPTESTLQQAPTFSIEEKLNTAAVPSVPSAPTAPTESALQQAPTYSIEEKNVSINEWLQLSSQVQPDNNVDVNEFLQFASLPILSDIEDDAYQLSTYLDFNDQTNNVSRNVTTANPKVQVPQQLIDGIPANSAINLTTNPDSVQPLDLSIIQQATPMSTDTGFCNESFSLDIVSSSHSISLPARATCADANGCTKSDGQAEDELSSQGKPFAGSQTKQQQPLTSLDTKPSASHEINTNSEPPLSAAAQSIEKQDVDGALVIVVPEINTPPELKSPQEVKQPSNNMKEEKISERVLLPPEWNIDGYSTDLDYEPSEDDDHESEDKLLKNCHQIYNITQPLDTGLKSESRKEKIAVKVVNDTSSDRVVTQMLAKQSTSTLLVNTVQALPANIKPNGPSVTPSGPSLPHYLAQPAAEDQIGVLKNQINYLLNRPCFDYMHDGSCSKLTCRYNHNLPTDREVLNKLKQFPTETILSVYTRFFVKNRMAFVNYFPTFCKIFSIRKQRSTLLRGVWHCDRLSKMSFYADIYLGFIGMDMLKVQALAEIANVSCKSRIACTYILNLIVKEDPQLFVAMLREYYPRANVETHHMLSLLYRLYDNPAPSLLNVFVDIFDKYSRSDISDVEPYKMIVYELRSLIVDDFDLIQRLNAIVSRDKRLNS